MRHPFRHLKRVLATTVLALGGLVAATATPAAHAGCATSTSVEGFAQGAHIFGSCFIPGVQVRVELLTTDLRDDLASGHVYADNTGSFEAQLNTTYVGTVYVVADEICSSCTGDSYWKTTYIDPAPYLTTFGSLGIATGAQASGFTPGGVVTFYEYNSNWILLGTQQVVVTASGFNAGFASTYFNLNNPGTIHVVAQQTSPFSWYSNWVTAYD